MKIAIEVPEGAECEMREALAEAIEYVRKRAEWAPLRSQKFTTRRYVWQDVRHALAVARDQVRG